jgi:hypothetical protein
MKFFLTGIGAGIRTYFRSWLVVPFEKLARVLHGCFDPAALTKSTCLKQIALRVSGGI